MKSYTDLELSKKLAEILPLESADMYWVHVVREGFNDWWKAETIQGVFRPYSMNIRCWSLAALLSVLPKHIKDYNVLRIDIGEKDFSIWYDEIGFGVNSDLPDITMEEPIDACYEMIVELHELKML